MQPDRGQPGQASPTTRMLAVVGLIALVVAVIGVAALSVGTSDEGTTETVRESGPDIEGVDLSKKRSKDIKTALDRGEYIVEEGDSLTSISAATGIDIETLEQLNPGIDPQTLAEGARIRLK